MFLLKRYRRCVGAAIKVLLVFRLERRSGHAWFGSSLSATDVPPLCHHWCATSDRSRSELPTRVPPAHNTVCQTREEIPMFTTNTTVFSQTKHDLSIICAHNFAHNFANKFCTQLCTQILHTNFAHYYVTAHFCFQLLTRAAADFECESAMFTVHKDKSLTVSGQSLDNAISH